MYDRSREEVEWFGAKILKKKQVQKRAYMIKNTDPVTTRKQGYSGDHKPSLEGKNRHKHNIS
jgi:hypothetical protein